MTAHQNPYQAAIQAVACFVIPLGGFLRVGGKDRLDFLQRQTTNDLRQVQDGRAVLSVLTTPAARILDVLYVLPGPDELDLITLPGRGESTARYFKSRIFFMDQVSLADASAEMVQVDLVGPDVPNILVRLGVDPALQPGRLAGGAFGGRSLQALALEPTFGLGVRLLLPVSDLDAFTAFLTQAGVARLQDEDYSLLRLEAGLPAPGAELSEEYTPLEAGLAAAVSGAKGCYTGQEVIARQITYDKVTQHLCGLRLGQQAQPGGRVWAIDGSPVGKVTSARTSPRFGEIALAVVKRPNHEPGSAVKVGETFQSAVQAQVVSLPFRLD